MIGMGSVVGKCRRKGSGIVGSISGQIAQSLIQENFDVAQQRVESIFALLATDAESIRKAIATLNEVERKLSQWYGD